MYLPIPSCVIPRETLTPVFGTSANLIVSFGCAQIASARSTPTFPFTTSNAATTSTSRMWYQPRLTCIRPGTNCSSSASLVGEPLHERVRAVADADDRDADLVLLASARGLVAVGLH